MGSILFSYSPQMLRSRGQRVNQIYLIVATKINGSTYKLIQEPWRKIPINSVRYPFKLSQKQQLSELKKTLLK